MRQNTVYVPTSYVEPGFVAIDEYGGNRPDKVTVTSDIDINTVGTYTVTYVLKSNLGDTIDTETRTVIVYDGIPPMVTTAVATSNNTTNNKYAINGNTVTLNLTFTKSVTDPTVTIGGRTATVTGSGNTRVATYTIPAGEAALTEGPLSVNVSNYYDIWNNLGLEQTNVTSGGLVTYDRTAPAVPTIAYTNGYITVTTQSVTFSSSDTISGILNYTLYRRSATLTNNMCGTYGAWSSLETQTSPYTSTVVSGNCYQYYVLTTNGAGLTSSSTTSPTAATKVDTTAPNAPTITASGTEISKTVTLSGSTDGESDILRYEYSLSGATTLGWTSGSSFTITNPGITLVSARAVNNAGLTSTTSTQNVSNDATPPTITYTNSGSWYSTLPATTITVQDIASGMATLRYAWTTTTADPAGITSTTCTGGTAITASGTAAITNATATGKPTTTGSSYYLHVCAVDVANNVRKSYSRYYLDATNPTCGTWTPSVSPWKASGGQTFTLASSTDTGSGINVAGGSCTTGTANGNTCTVGISDNVGRTATCTSPPNRVDTTAPSVPTLTVSEAWTRAASVSGTISGSTDAQSGILRYEYSMSGATTLGWTSGSSFSVTNAGQTTVTVRAINGAGTASTTTAKVVSIDRTAPTCAVSGGSTAWTNGSRTVTGTCSDTGGSGCTGNISYAYTTQINTTTAGAAGNSVGGTVYDNAGNSVACAANQTVRIDKTAPTCTATKSNIGSTSGVTVTVAASDGQSGINTTTSQIGTFYNVTSTTSYTVYDNVGYSGSCSASVSSYSCNPYNCNPYNCNPYSCNPYSCNPYNCNPYSCNCTWVQTGQVFSSSGCTGNWTGTSLGCSSITATTPSPYYICTNKDFCKNSSGNYCYASNSSCVCSTTTRYWRRTECTASCSTCYNTCYDTCYQTCYQTCYNTCYQTCYNTCYQTCYQ